MISVLCIGQYEKEGRLPTIMPEAFFLKDFPRNSDKERIFMERQENMNDGYWKGVPDEYIEEWKNIFLNSTKAVLNEKCPVCNTKMLRQYRTIKTGRTDFSLF